MIGLALDASLPQTTVFLRTLAVSLPALRNGDIRKSDAAGSIAANHDAGCPLAIRAEDRVPIPRTPICRIRILPLLAPHPPIDDLARRQHLDGVLQIPFYSRGSVRLAG
jgi:hypothetical protein